MEYSQTNAKDPAQSGEVRLNPYSNGILTNNSGFQLMASSVSLNPYSNGILTN